MQELEPMFIVQLPNLVQMVNYMQMDFYLIGMELSEIQCIMEFQE